MKFKQRNLKTVIRFFVTILAFLIVTVTLAQARTETLVEFLAALDNNLSLEAARASLLASEANLRQARDPAKVEVGAIYDSEPDLSSATTIVSTDLVLRPFIFGSAAEEMQKRKLELKQAQLDYNETLSRLEAQALEAAFNVKISKLRLVLATQKHQLATEELSAILTKFDAGVATIRERRDAELALIEAQSLLTKAEIELTLAEQMLRSFVGDRPLEIIPELPIPQGDFLEVARAQIAVDIAKDSREATKQTFLPVLDASYNYHLSSQSTLSASINSSTFQPRLGYIYEVSASHTPGSSFSVGLSMTISVSDFDALDARSRELQAAEKALDNALQEAELQLQRIENNYFYAQQELNLAQNKFEDAQLDLQEAKAQESLGLTTSLVTQRAAVALTEAELNLQLAELAVSQSVLEYYKLYAQPISETLP